MSGRGILSDMRRAGLWLALVAFMLKAAIPAGYMLASEGPATVVLCTANGAVTVALDAPGGGHDQNTPAANADHCVFAGLTAPALSTDVVSVAAPLQRFVHVTTAIAVENDAVSQTGPPLPARGPPTFV